MRRLPAVHGEAESQSLVSCQFVFTFALPQFFRDDLELHDVILHMADDLYRGEVTKM